MLGREVWVHPFLCGSGQLLVAIIDVCGLFQWLSGKDCLQCRRTGSIPGLGRSPTGDCMATHSSILAWRIPWTEEEPGGLQSIGLQKV